MHRNLILILPLTTLAWITPGSPTHPQIPTKSRPNVGSEPAKNWVRWPPEEFMFGQGEPIDKKDTFEVVTSMREVVVEGELCAQPFQRIDPDKAEAFTGHYYRCPAGKTPYLVRAVYGHGSTGSFSFRRIGKRLCVDHASLGHEIGPFKTAFVLNLDFEPEILYISYGFAL